MSKEAATGTTKNSLVVGNCAKLREALEAIDRNTGLLDIAENIAPKLHPSHSFVAVQIRKIVRAALAKPARNCDVGTADDWLARFSVFCERCSGSDCDHRLFKDEEVCACFARWLQMPYKEQEGGAK